MKWRQIKLLGMNSYYFAFSSIYVQFIRWHCWLCHLAIVRARTGPFASLSIELITFEVKCSGWTILIWWRLFLHTVNIRRHYNNIVLLFALIYRCTVAHICGVFTTTYEFIFMLFNKHYCRSHSIFFTDILTRVINVGESFKYWSFFLVIPPLKMSRHIAGELELRSLSNGIIFLHFSWIWKSQNRIRGCNYCTCYSFDEYCT